ncbi:hypothetical protein GLAREA_07547 [Glarea lozoyensis ATCC 20868]|uniref:Uncharacterized protein n=1 Tax=Glarea lozoyensis (strain ATCC 20868 / MF5171) TaxID=1116229 RepID=S3D5L9_GLAL2|nr:uncharacterized protein GLAREA_07547 [Glarea lozoyensis ATCC 20868]EPE32414.1 hypothetical protein GLAREA_07547 [Glarea lozoyensis ATCC 20868]
MPISARLLGEWQLLCSTVLGYELPYDHATLPGSATPRYEQCANMDEEILEGFQVWELSEIPEPERTFEFPEQTIAGTHPRVGIPQRMSTATTASSNNLPTSPTREVLRTSNRTAQHSLLGNDQVIYPEEELVHPDDATIPSSYSTETYEEVRETSSYNSQAYTPDYNADADPAGINRPNHYISDLEHAPPTYWPLYDPTYLADFSQPPYVPPLPMYGLETPYLIPQGQQHRKAKGSDQRQTSGKKSKKNRRARLRRKEKKLSGRRSGLEPSRELERKERKKAIRALSKASF